MGVEAKNNKRIAKNTLVLYVRLFFSMLVALYTSRVILNVLGIENYGIYNVVCGVVVVFSCLNEAMTGATQRFITFELGEKDQVQLNRVYSTSIQTHWLIGIVFITLAELFGLWFLYNEMELPLEKMDVAVFIFHVSLLSTFLQILNVPYRSLIIAHERMIAFSTISVLDIVLKLLVVLLLQNIGFDKLKVYSLLMLSVSTTICIINYGYCRLMFRQVRFQFYYHKILFCDMLSFASLSFVGNLSAMAFTQGLNLMLNVFFGPVVNAARGIAVQVQGAVGSFGGSFQTALNPQITKSYAEGNYIYLHKLVISSSKYTFLLLYLIAFPILVETNAILVWWLKTVPPHTAQFIRITIFVTILMAMANPITTAVHATGRIKTYQLVVGGMHLLILPISYIVLKIGYGPESAFIVNLLVVLITLFARIKILSELISLSWVRYSKEVLLPVCNVLLLSTLGMKIVDMTFSFSPLLMLSGSFLLVILLIFIIGINRKERYYIYERIKCYTNKLNGKAGR